MSKRIYKQNEISDEFKPKLRYTTSEKILAILGLVTIIIYIFSTFNMEEIYIMNIISIVSRGMLVWIILLEVYFMLERKFWSYSLVVRGSSLIYTSLSKRTIMLLPFCIIGTMQDGVISSRGKAHSEWITLNHDLKFNPNDVDKNGRTIEEFLKEVIKTNKELSS